VLAAFVNIPGYIACIIACMPPYIMDIPTQVANLKC
ncbi:uncharacterized protein METZ01_LOCUS342531, partial [marine metagenome]